jgi:hypothetical protein
MEMWVAMISPSSFASPAKIYDIQTGRRIA